MLVPLQMYMQQASTSILKKNAVRRDESPEKLGIVVSDVKCKLSFCSAIRHASLHENMRMRQVCVRLDLSQNRADRPHSATVGASLVTCTTS